MKILVTGGAGFIGSHVADALVADGHEVHVMDDLSSGRVRQVPAGALLHRLDIRSQGAASLIANERFAVLVHHAAQMDVRRSVMDPRYDLSVNLGGFLNLIEAGRKSGLQRVVFASTGGAIYGEPKVAPQPESHALQPVSPYGITKLATEKYLHYYAVQYGIPFVALRYGNVYGPRQNPHGEAGVVAIFIERLLSGRPVTIFGDGLQTRDYVYVQDVAQANLAALSYDGPSRAFNIGTGRETSVVDLYQSICAALDVDRAAQHAPGKPGEQRRSVLDPASAQQHLSWTPSTPLASGLEATAAWFGSRL